MSLKYAASALFCPPDENPAAISNTNPVKEYMRGSKAEGSLWHHLVTRQLSLEVRDRPCLNPNALRPRWRIKK